MQIDRQLLDGAVERGELTPAQAEALLAEAARLRARAAGDAPGWRHVAGAAALGLGSALALVGALEWLGFAGLAAGATGLGLALLAAGRRRHARSDGRDGQVLLCAAVLLAPVAAHGLARTLGLGQPFAGVPATLQDWLAGPWFPVQAAAALAAGLGLRAFRIPFLAWPLAVAAWFAAQDAAPVLLGGDPGWDQRVLVSALSGLVFLAAGVAADGRTRGDVASWLYLPGLLAFTGGLVTWTGAGPASLALVALLHAGLVLASLLVRRRAFAVAGALGLAAAAGRLADDQLEPGAVPFVLAGVVLALLGAGLGYQLHHERLAARARALVPAALRRWLPAGRASASEEASR